MAMDEATGNDWRDRWTASTYDQWTSPHQAWRELMVEALPVARGSTVVDVGCGTGLCFRHLVQKVGPTGRVIGVDSSEEMLALAARRVAQRHWPQIVLVHAPAATARLPVTADAAVFCAVHDLLQDEAAVDNVIDQLRPRAAVAAVGGRWMHPLMLVHNLAIYLLHAPYVHDFHGFDRPWLVLAGRLASWRVQGLAGGSGYLLLGRTDRGRSCPADDVRRAGATGAGPWSPPPPRATPARRAHADGGVRP